MSWLKKIGVAILKVVGVVSGVLPLVTAALPSSARGATVITDTLTKIGGVIVNAEAMIGAISDPKANTGPQKLQAAAPLVAQIIQTSELLAGKNIKNEALFISACTGITSNVADLLNSLE